MITIEDDELLELIKKHVLKKHGVDVDKGDYHIEIEHDKVTIGKVIMCGPSLTIDEVTTKSLDVFNKIMNGK